jgi:hypothetical protein
MNYIDICRKEGAYDFLIYSGGRKLPSILYRWCSSSLRVLAERGIHLFDKDEKRLAIVMVIVAIIMLLSMARYLY